MTDIAKEQVEYRHPWLQIGDASVNTTGLVGVVSNESGILSLKYNNGSTTRLNLCQGFNGYYKYPKEVCKGHMELMYMKIMSKITLRDMERMEK